MDSSDALLALKQRLAQFEKTLGEILEQSTADIETARALQKRLMPARLPQITGIHCFAKFVPGFELSAEGFDIIPTKQGKDVWIVIHSTGSFGLSSVLLQALVRLQTQALVQQDVNLQPSDVWTSLCKDIQSSLQREQSFRLMVAKLETHKLKLHWAECGSFSPRLQAKGGTAYVPAGDLAASNTPSVLGPNTTPPMREGHDVVVSPGTRVLFCGSSWTQGLNNDDVAKVWTRFEELRRSRSRGLGGDLQEDLNDLCFQIEESKASHNKKGDLACVALEIDARKLHLAG